MAYSKAKLKSSGDKESPFLDHFGWENCQINDYLYGLYFMFHLNTFYTASLISWRFQTL
jgi:hypothetical protein